MKLGIMLSLLSAIDVSCPPRLKSFDVHRDYKDSGWVHSTGGVVKENYRLEVDYWDNRKENAYIFHSDGRVILENLTDQNRFVKYRHWVKIPFGEYTISKNGEYYEVCADNGKVTFALKSYVFTSTPSLIPWSYTVTIDPYGDLNNDGCVNGNDLGMFFGNWGLDGVSDFNSDGVTDGEDLAILLANWNDVC
jgi:hypothetical protein|tara:strand:- start:1411 stop:1986 length:576 start_codon:yes stop_codon:yes gene_type:complete